MKFSVEINSEFLSYNNKAKQNVSRRKKKDYN